MAGFLTNRGAELIDTQALNLTTATLKARMVMSDTTVDTERDKLVLTGYTDIDVCDGSAYADLAIVSPTLARDDTNDRIIFDADNLNFPTVGAGTRQSTGLLIYQDNGTEATNVPLFWVPFPSAQTHNGDDFPVSWHATEGIYYRDLT